MIVLGVILAGLIMMAGPVPGLVRAMSTGTLIGKGHGAPRILRSEEPERFSRLLKQRFTALVPGAALFLGGLSWIVLNLLAAATQGSVP
jgi:hypothetical protein